MDDITKSIIVCVIAIIFIIADAIKMFYDICKKDRFKYKLKKDIEIFEKRKEE